MSDNPNVQQSKSSTLRKRSIGTRPEAIRYRIAVRGRPVQGPGGAFATHCYLVLLSGTTVIDSLSFDPSNSVGWQDADPSNTQRGEQTVESNCDISRWERLAEAFQANVTQKKTYSLSTFNCCHAVMGGLVATNLEHATQAISFARSANNTWDNINRNASAGEFEKKNA